jgi:hypothetical protein
VAGIRNAAGPGLRGPACVAKEPCSRRSWPGGWKTAAGTAQRQNLSCRARETVLSARGCPREDEIRHGGPESCSAPLKPIRERPKASPPTSRIPWLSGLALLLQELPRDREVPP